MITQNTLLDFMTKASIASQDNKPSVSIEKSASNQFKETFNRAMEDVQSKKKDLNSSNKLQNNSSQRDIKHGKDDHFNTYREAERNNSLKSDNGKVKTVKSDVVKVSGNDDDLDKTDDVKNKKDAGKTKDEAAVNIFANILGMDVKDLTKVLENMGIKPEDLTNQSKISDVVNKMSSLLGLGDQQKQALAGIMKIFESQLDSVAGEMSPNPDITFDLIQSNNDNSGNKGNMLDDSVKDVNENTIKVDSLKIEASNNNKTFVEFEDLMAKFKSKLEELMIKFTQSPNEVSNSFAEGIKKILAQLNTQNTNTGLNTDSKSSTDDLSIKETKEVKVNTNIVKDSNGIKQDEKQDEKQDDKTVNAVVDKADSADSKESGDDMQGDSKAALNHGTQNANVKSNADKTTGIDDLLHNQVQNTVETDTTTTTKVQKDVPVSKSELFKQIIDKASVVTSGDKSEMVMDLKPDSLGKLSLKIVTEHGIVSAKFVAESQQVKEVLESNMQLLKDSLEKQGLSVQSFSVSVGQQSPDGFRRESEYNENPKEAGRRVETTGPRTIGVQNVSGTQDRINPYSWSESRINLTA